jgi:hypothetical protein
VRQKIVGVLTIHGQHKEISYIIHTETLLKVSIEQKSVQCKQCFMYYAYMDSWLIVGVNSRVDSFYGLLLHLELCKLIVLFAL